jgi:hypothetical protein
MVERGAARLISAHIKSARRRPRLLAVFSYRYDAHLVPAMLANIEPLVDGWIAYDDRASADVFSNEVARRSALLNAAVDAGAAWALAVDPDERFEQALAAALPTLCDAMEAPRAYTFAMREMYSDRHYRIDGVWGQKRQARLLSLKHGLATPQGDLHLSWSSFIPAPQLGHTDYNIYHLKMITPARRKARADLYNFLDPERRMQHIGYDYLADDAGAQLEQIPAGREFLPPHREDGGLWMAEVPVCT